MSDAKSTSESEGEKHDQSQPSSLPSLRRDDEIVVSTKYGTRTLTVEEIREDAYILTGYGTQYQIGITPRSNDPDWVMLKWPSQPEGEIVTNIEVDRSDQIPEGILRKVDVEGPFMAKIGTYTPQQIWIHTDDTPVEEGDKFRFVKADPDDKHENWGSEQTAGVVDEIRDRAGTELLFVTEESTFETDAERQNSNSTGGLDHAE